MRGRNLIFAGILLLLPVVILVVGAEFVLRVVKFGYKTTPLIEIEAADGNFLVGNPDFTRLFFPSALKRLPPNNRVAVVKPEGTRRFMVVGGSAVAGDPNPDFSIGRNLQWLLTKAHPQLNWEVLNLAYTACNSHVAAEVVRQSKAYDLDGIIVLVGNNEVIGPFGPGTLLASGAGSKLLRRIQLQGRKTKIGQLAQSLFERAAPQAGEHAEWRGMEHFLEHRIATDDPRLQRVYADYRSNLMAIGAEAQRQGIPVVLSNVPVNLVHQPPFHSLDDDLEEPFLNAIQAFLQNGELRLTAEETRRAATAASRSANLAFITGRTVLESDSADAAAAQALLQRACDLDLLRFRADREINAVVESLWAQPDGPWLPVDAIAALKADHPRNLLGFPHFYEHVHFTFRANFMIARAMAAQIIEYEGGSKAQLEGISWSDAAAGLAYHEFAAWRILESVMQRFSQPPFSQIQGFGRTVQWMETLRQDLESHVSQAANKQRIYEVTTAAIAARPEDDRLKLQLATFLAANGQPAAIHLVLSDLFDRHPTDMGLAMDYLEVSLQVGDAESANAAYDRIIREFGEHSRIEAFRPRLEALGNRN